jgi:hypothetical protein
MLSALGLSCSSFPDKLTCQRLGQAHVQITRDKCTQATVTQKSAHTGDSNKCTCQCSRGSSAAPAVKCPPQLRPTCVLRSIDCFTSPAALGHEAAPESPSRLGRTAMHPQRHMTDDAAQWHSAPSGSHWQAASVYVIPSQNWPPTGPDTPSHRPSLHAARAARPPCGLGSRAQPVAAPPQGRPAERAARDTDRAANCLAQPSPPGRGTQSMGSRGAPAGAADA